MPKARMTALDVRAMTSCIAPVVKRLRVANVYDISSKVYVLKLAEGDTKRHLVCEAGVRFHLSDWKRDKQAVPSVFTMRLRRFLRSKRVAALRQLGYSRVIDVQLGYDENAYHLIVEFYARGNVIVTDHEYIVKATWRQFRGDEEYSVKMHQRYPVEHHLGSAHVFLYGIREAATDESLTEQLKEGAQHVIDNRKKLETTADKKALKKKGAAGVEKFTVADIASELIPLAPRKLVDRLHSELGKQLFSVDDPTALANLRTLTAAVVRVFDSFSVETGPVTRPPGPGEPREVPSEPPDVKGYASYVGPAEEEKPDEPQKRDSSREQIDAAHNLRFEDFAPLRDMVEDPRFAVKEYGTFYECVDQYYSSVELTKMEEKQSKKVLQMESKIDRIRRDQQERVDKLKAEAELCEKHALCLEMHVEFAEKAIKMMQMAVQTGSDWNMLVNMVKEQRRLGHPIASYISALDLNNNRFTLLLPDETAGKGALEGEGEGDGEGDLPLVPIDLNILETAFANVTRLHSTRRAAKEKFQRTEVAAKQAIAAAEKAAEFEKQRKELIADTRPAIQRIRKVFWFEKFYWFISSDGYLVLAGHDATQNEILYRRYLTKNDLFVHADVHGAACCIVRNPHADRPVPPHTIDEAGQMSVCRSNAWKTKVLVQAYWVYAQQVSKTPQPGEYVATGGFIIRGKRNPILVKKLEMSIGLLFHLGDPESVKRHERDYRAAGVEGEEGGSTPPSFAEGDNLPASSAKEDNAAENKGSSSTTGIGQAVAYPIPDLSPTSISNSAHQQTLKSESLLVYSRSHASVGDDAAAAAKSQVSINPTTAFSAAALSRSAPHRVTTEFNRSSPQGENTDSSDIEAEPATTTDTGFRPLTIANVQPLRRARSEMTEGRRGSAYSSSKRSVHFGSIEVLPRSAIDPRVSFDDLPPEVIRVNSAKSILSEDEDVGIFCGRRSSGNSGACDEDQPESISDDYSANSDDEKVVASAGLHRPLPTRIMKTNEATRLSSRNDRSLSVSSSESGRFPKRSDSADEVSPPRKYAGKTAPRALLSQPLEEEEQLLPAEEDGATAFNEDGIVDSAGDSTMPPSVDAPPVTPGITGTAASAVGGSSETLARRRSYVVDGGPLPRGFLEAEVPPPKTLLQLGPKMFTPHDNAHHGQSRPEEKDADDSLSSQSKSPSSREHEDADDNSEADKGTKQTGPAGAQSQRTRLKKGGNSPTGITVKVPAKTAADGGNGSGASPDRMAGVKGTKKGGKIAGGAAAPKPKQMSRAKQKKLKKIAERYGEQSDEERSLMMKLAGAKQVKTEETIAAEEMAKRQAEKAKWKELDARKVEKLPDRNIAEEELDEEAEEDRRRRLDVLHELTGRPSQNDTLLCAIAVCAPSQATRNYTYQGKLTPGGGKKGHAVQLVSKAFIQMSEPNSVQRQLIKAVTADEISAVMVANPVVTIQGGDKIKKEEQKAKKAVSKAIAKAKKEAG